MRDKKDKAVMGHVSLYPDHWEFLRQYALDNGFTSTTNKAGANVSAGLQHIIDMMINKKEMS